MRRLSEISRAKREHFTTRMGSNLRTAETAAQRFYVERANRTTTLRWGANRQAKDLAAKRVLLAALALALLYMRGGDSFLLIVFGVLLLGCLYLLLAAQVNRMTIRASETEWIFQRGPLPTPDPDFGWMRLEKTVDPTRYYQVTSSAGVEEKGEYRWRFGRTRSLAGLLATLPLELASWHHHKTRAPRITYDLCMKSRRGLDLKVLSGLTGEQAEYLVEVLQPFLTEEESVPGRTDSQPAGLWWLRDEENRSLPGQAEPKRMTAAPQNLATSEDKGVAATQQTEVQASPVVCATCSASNPVESAFCGDCGAALVIGGI